MEELNTFEIFTRRILYFIGWFIRRFITLFGSGETSGSDVFVGLDSPLIWLTFGLFFAFAALHIFKRILRKD